jgi:hypothetical protein
LVVGIVDSSNQAIDTAALVRREIGEIAGDVRAFSLYFLGANTVVAARAADGPKHNLQTAAPADKFFLRRRMRLGFESVISQKNTIFYSVPYHYFLIEDRGVAPDFLPNIHCRPFPHRAHGVAEKGFDVLRILRRPMHLACARGPVPFLTFLAAFILAQTGANPSAAQRTTAVYMFNMKPSSVYDVSQNGSVTTDSYASPEGVVRFNDFLVPGDVIAVAEDSTANTQPPSPPLIQSAAETSPGCVQATWLPSGDPTVVGFELGIGSRSVAGGQASGYDRLLDVGNVSSYDLCGLSTGHYFLAVRARNQLGITSAFSVELSVDVASTAVTISAFDADVESAGPGTVILRWEVSSDEPLRGYRVYRSDPADEARGVPVHGEGILPPTARSLADNTVSASTRYRYTLVVIGEDGVEATSLSRTVLTPAARLELDQNVPNPFNPRTRISFVLPEAARVRLEVFDVEGRWVATLIDGRMPAGRHEVFWQGVDRNGTTVATGTYFYRLTAGKRSLSRKMLLLK